MKIILLIPLLLLLIASPAFGQLSDKTGLLTRFDVDASGHTFEVVTVSNFDLLDHEFDKDEKRLTLFINSGLENNLGELTIPKNLLGGNFTFYLDDVEITQKSKSNNIISFVTLNFTGIGNHKIDIVGTEALVDVKETEKELIVNSSQTLESESSTGGGCLIATATYGSELAPQVQQLRELRDNKLLRTESGKTFVTSFNQFYYLISPAVADYERENPLFKETIKLAITPLLSSLAILNHVDFDSEESVLLYGISMIVLNIGMYFGLPAIVLMRIRKI